MIPLYYQQDVELIKPYVSGLDDGLMGHLPTNTLPSQRRDKPTQNRKHVVEIALSLFGPGRPARC